MISQPLPVLSLDQPWASLTMVGTRADEVVKTIETRSWRAPAKLIGRRLGVHATARKPRVRSEVGAGAVDSTTLLLDDNRRVTSYRWVVNRGTMPGVQAIGLPLGHLIGTVELVACVPMLPPGDHPIEQVRHGALVIDELTHRLYLYPSITEPAVDVSDQYPYGWYLPGRWAWIFADPQPLSRPIPARGAQRIWHWNGKLA